VVLFSGRRTFIPSPGLLHAHLGGLTATGWSPNCWAGSLQPGTQGQPDAEKLRHPFSPSNSLQPARAVSSLEGNFSLPTPKMAPRSGRLLMRTLCVLPIATEAELAYRWRQAGLSIRYISEVVIDHLQAQRGGTRSYGQAPHNNSGPDHWFGRFISLRTQPLLPALLGMFTWICPGLVIHHAQSFTQTLVDSAGLLAQAPWDWHGLLDCHYRWSGLFGYELRTCTRWPPKRPPQLLVD